MPTATPPALRVESLSKSFGVVQALRDVSMTVEAGTIHALLGRNGSGKSTIIKILSGYHAADSGSIWVAGERMDEVPAARSRMAFVHQDLGVLPRLSVLENVALGRDLPMRRGRIDWPRLRLDVAQVLEPFGIVDLGAPLASLTRGEAAIVAIARALYGQSDLRLMVLDEPTSALPVADRVHLFRTMRELASRGIGVLFVTHHLHEAVSVASAATVLRDGRVAATETGRGVDEATLIRHMLGGVDLAPMPEVRRSAAQRAARAAPLPALRLTAVHGSTIRDVNLEVHRGEIVAVVGLRGSGLEELALAASGRLRPTSGSVELGTGSGSVPAARAAADGRIGLVPGERLAQALFIRLSVRENISVSRPQEYLARGRISKRAESAAARAWAARLGIVPSDVELPIGGLSGGNQQKAVLARWLHIAPLALVAIEPTQGVDLAAKRDLLEQLRRVAADLPVLLVSHEPEEVLPVCDRVLVMRSGALAMELDRRDARADLLLEAFA